jgi:hypothetical protein
MSAMYGGVKKRKRVGEDKDRLSRDLGEYTAFWRSGLGIAP